MIEFDIIIPHYGIDQRLTDLCRRCLTTIREHSYNYRLLFVDNGSPGFDQVIDDVRQHPHLLIRNRLNQGFIKAVNQALCLSTAPYVIIMNNDTEAVPLWLERMQRAFSGPIGMVGPRTTAQKSWQGRWRGRGGVMTLPVTAMLAFFCVMIRRQVINKVGLLDEDFGLGLGDDDAYCLIVHRAGYRLALVQDLVIPHHHRSTFHTMWTPEQVLGMQRVALEKFHQKRRSLRLP